MSSSEGRDIEPFDWFNRFFGGGGGGRRRGFGFPDIFRGFDEMKREMEREFGNVKSPLRGDGGAGFFRTPMISSEREPLADVTSTDKEVKVAVEMPGVSKQNIKINAYNNSVEVTSTDPDRKYHQVIEIPPETNIETAKSVYNNGILEITFKKKEQTKPEGKQINIE